MGDDEKYSQGDSDVSEAEDDDSNNSNHNNNAPIMSLFASYYGIEDPTKNPDVNGGRGTIDDANFIAEEYVKELLLNESLEGLTMKDAEMVHEIRTLDGEMQKLVYDNYNKFITATETVKEMKKDIYSMDNDMDSVRAKMNSITHASQELDNLLEDKRVTVDKLVRVRRLLERLEFLSELPERLANMIENKLYIDAVKLYNKTISVLTRHSHVLSFKNIKERTELMMADLTEKVIDMLDDSTLEAVKLTQFVNILRLMNAPRDKVLKKFLSAHSRRSITMTSQFNESIDNKSQSVATARQYHQSMLVGLIESCKGIHELYQGTSSLPLSENDSVLAQIETEFYNSIQRTFQDYTKTLSKGFHAFFQRYHEVFRNVNLDLSPLTEENVVLIQDFNLDLRAPSVPSQEEADTSSNHFNYQDERGSWLLLARQSILDVKYLDSTFTETCQLFHLSAKKRAIPGQLFSSAYSDSILTEIDIHTTFMRKHFLKSFVADLIIWFPRHLTIVQASSEETSSSSADRTLFQKKWQAIQVLMSLTSTHASEAFSECARYIKPLVDIYEVAALDPSILCKKLIVEFSTFLVQEIESSCGLLRNRTLLKDKKLFQEEDHDIYEVAELEFNKQIGYEFDRKSNSAVKENILLYFAGILKYLLKSLPEIVVEELSSHEFPPIEDTSLEQGLSQRKIEETVRDLISYFIEVNARYSAEVLALASLEHYQQHYSKVSQGNEVSTVKSITISDKTQAFLEYLDQIAATGYLLFLESPPQVRSSTGDQRRTPGRQSIAMGNSNLALQMDIERLFSQRVKVFNTVTASSGNEVIISTVLKAAIKSVQEEIRNSTLVYEAYVQIRAEIGLLKSISPYLIKETSEIDSLVDLLLSTVFSRYVGANDISNVNDTSEVGLVSKAHSEVLQRMADRLSLVGKTR